MKKKTLLILAVLITALACLFTSCSASVEPPKAEEEFGYVTFGNGGSRSLSTEYGIKSYNDLVWYYTAEKKDGFGKTGETRDDSGNLVETRINNTTGLSGEVGPLSQGAWEFKLYAYEVISTTDESGQISTTSTLVYQGTSATIVLKGGETKAVPVSVSLQGAKGKIDLSRAYFQWANDSTATGQIYVTVKLANANGDLTPTILGPLSKTSTEGYQFGSTSLVVNDSADIKADYYTCTINAYLASDVDSSNENTGATINQGATPVATQVMGLRVYGNATTYITGNLVESPNTYVDFTVPQQSMVAFNQNEARVPSNPAGTGNTLPTTVNFGSNLNSSATHILTLEVADIDTSSAKFTVDGDQSAVASLSFDLKAIGTNGSGAATQSPVDNFDTPVTVTTYIAKGLSNVQVKYNGTGDEPGAMWVGDSTDSSKPDTNYYESDTGKLVFDTNHFSEYYAVADSFAALNVTTNTAYKDTESQKGLVAALGAADSGHTIKLYSDVSLTSVLEIGKTIVIDGNGHNIFNTATRVIRITQPNLDVQLYNLGVISECTAGEDVRGISFDNISSGSSLLLDGCTVSASFYAINVVSGPKNLNITIKNGTVAAGWAAINSYSNDSTFTIENSTLRGLNDKGESSWNSFATIVFDGNSNIGGNGSNNIMNITNSTIYASSNSSNKQRWLSIQYGAQNNHITLDSETKIIDESGNDQSENITIGPFVGYDSTKKRYLKSYDVHSLLTVDSEMINICYHGEIDYNAILDNGFHVPYEGCEDIEWSNVVTITPEKVSSTTWNSDTLYYLAPGQYNDFSVYLHGKENVGFCALPEATFTKVEIGYHSNQDSSLSAKQNSTLTIKGFNVDGELKVNSADQKVVIEENTAAQMTVKTYQLDNMDIQVINNTLTGGSDRTKAPQQYGLYIVPNKTNYDLNICGNTFCNVYSHAIGVQGQGDGSAVTAANSIIVQNNTFESYGLNQAAGRAAFKIWEDTKYAPTANGNITESARVLVNSIKEDNTYSNNLGANCVLGNFYDTLVPFNE